LIRKFTSVHGEESGEGGSGEGGGGGAGTAPGASAKLGTNSSRGGRRMKYVYHERDTPFGQKQLQKLTLAKGAKAPGATRAAAASHVERMAKVRPKGDDEVEFGDRALNHYPQLPAGGHKGSAGSSWCTLSLTPPPAKLVESSSGVWQVWTCARGRAACSTVLDLSFPTSPCLYPLPCRALSVTGGTPRAAASLLFQRARRAHLSAGPRGLFPQLAPVSALLPRHPPRSLLSLLSSALPPSFRRQFPAPLSSRSSPPFLPPSRAAAL